MEISQRNKLKKDRERYFLESFIEKSGLNISDIRDGDDSGCEPDFFAKYNDAIIGIELVERFSDSNPESNDPSSLKEHTEVINKTIQELVRMYYQLSSIPVSAQLITLRIKSDEEPRLNREDLPLIAKVIESHSGNMQEWEQRRFEIEDRIFVYLTRLPSSEAGYNLWSFVSNSSGWVKTVDKQFANGAISEKGKLLRNYKTSVNSVILLIYVHGTTKAGLVQLSDDESAINNPGFLEIYSFVYPHTVQQLA